MTFKANGYEFSICGPRYTRLCEYDGLLWSIKPFVQTLFVTPLTICTGSQRVQSFAFTFLISHLLVIYLIC